MMSPRQHLIIVGTVLLVAAFVTFQLGRTESIGWVLAVVIVVAHIGVITMLAKGARQLVARRKRQRDGTSDPQ